MTFHLVKRPTVEIITPPLFPHPARNFLASMLAKDIADLAPKTVLDAGAGILRTLHLFPPGSYTGVGLKMEELEEGLTDQADFIAKHGAPALIATDLNNDFRFLGTFDLVVCTGAAVYFDVRQDRRHPIRLPRHTS